LQGVEEGLIGGNDYIFRRCECICILCFLLDLRSRNQVAGFAKVRNQLRKSPPGPGMCKQT